MRPRMRRRGPLLAAFLLLTAGWLVARRFVHVDVRFSDVPLYRSYGERMGGGQVPYRDIPIEYPPAALPFFALPALLSSSLAEFRLVFESMVLVCGLGILWLVDVYADQVGLSRRRRTLALAFAAFARFFLGALHLSATTCGRHCSLWLGSC